MQNFLDSSRASHRHQAPSQDWLEGGGDLGVMGQGTKGAEIETPQASRGVKILQICLNCLTYCMGWLLVFP